MSGTNEGVCDEIERPSLVPIPENVPVEQMLTEAMLSDSPPPAILNGSHTDGQVQASNLVQPLQSDLITPMSATSGETEPFPDYYESCEGGEASSINKEHEDAYNYAISKVVEEVIRFREVDSNITNLATRASSPCFSQPSIGTNNPKDNTSNKLAVPKSSMSYKTSTLPQMRRLLEHHCLKSPLRRRFTAMCNMIVRMEYILFRQHGSSPNQDQFLTLEDVQRVRPMAIEIMKYVFRLGVLIRDQFQNALRARYIIAELASEIDVPIEVRFKRMARMMICNLDRPRDIEITILKWFLKFFELWIYSDFIPMYNHQVDSEGELVQRVEICLILTSIRQNLGRSIEGYNMVVSATMDIKNRFIQPALAQMMEAPHSWQESVTNQRIWARAGQDIILERLQAGRNGQVDAGLFGPVQDQDEQTVPNGRRSQNGRTFHRTS